MRPAHGSSERNMSLMVSVIYSDSLGDNELFLSAFSADGELSVGILFAFSTFSELIFSTKWTVYIVFSEVFTTELTLWSLDAFLDQTFVIEYFFLEEIYACQRYPDSQEYQEVVPEHEELEILKEFHDCLQESLWDDL